MPDYCKSNLTEQSQTDRETNRQKETDGRTDGAKKGRKEGRKREGKKGTEEGRKKGERERQLRGVIDVSRINKPTLTTLPLHVVVDQSTHILSRSACI